MRWYLGGFQEQDSALYEAHFDHDYYHKRLNSPTQSTLLGASHPMASLYFCGQELNTYSTSPPTYADLGILMCYTNNNVNIPYKVFTSPELSDMVACVVQMQH